MVTRFFRIKNNCYKAISLRKHKEEIKLGLSQTSTQCFQKLPIVYHESRLIAKFISPDRSNRLTNPYPAFILFYLTPMKILSEVYYTFISYEKLQMEINYFSEHLRIVSVYISDFHSLDKYKY